MDMESKDLMSRIQTVHFMLESSGFIGVPPEIIANVLLQHNFDEHETVKVIKQAFQRRNECAAASTAGGGGGGEDEDEDEDEEMKMAIALSLQDDQERKGQIADEDEVGKINKEYLGVVEVIDKKKKKTKEVIDKKKEKTKKQIIKERIISKIRKEVNDSFDYYYKYSDTTKVSKNYLPYLGEATVDINNRVEFILRETLMIATPGFLVSEVKHSAKRIACMSLALLRIKLIKQNKTGGGGSGSGGGSGGGGGADDNDEDEDKIQQLITDTVTVFLEMFACFQRMRIQGVFRTEKLILEQMTKKLQPVGIEGEEVLLIGTTVTTSDTKVKIEKSEKDVVLDTGNNAGTLMSTSLFAECKAKGFAIHKASPPLEYMTLAGPGGSDRYINLNVSFPSVKTGVIMKCYESSKDSPKLLVCLQDIRQLNDRGITLYKTSERTISGVGTKPPRPRMIRQNT